jgi:aminopeptidase N
VLTRPAAALAAFALVAGGTAALRHGSGGDEAAAATAQAAPTDAGAAGIGDPYYPLDGNGGIDVLSYDIRDRYRFGTGRLSGRTVVTLRTTQALSSFDLDFLLPVQRVRLSTGAATFSQAEHHELAIVPQSTIPAGTRLQATITYAGKPGAHRYAGESNWVANAREVEAVNEPHIAPWWFPSNDHPPDKARMSVRITVPRGRQVVSNGRLIGVRRHGDLATYHWGGGEPMATYLAFFVAGRFQVEKGTEHHLPYYLAVSRALPDPMRKAAMNGLSTTPGIVHWLQQQVGRYPFARTGGVVTALNPGFSLENQTRPVYPRQVFRLLMVHELAHQWFGDSVSVHHWSDVWLNEGFATYLEQLWTEKRRHGPTTSEWLHNMYDTYGQDDTFWNGVVSDPGSDIADLFAWPVVYQRGGMTLAALRNVIGTPTFTELVHRWTRENRYGHGTTDAFEAMAEDVSGQDLTSFFDSWVRQSGKPDATATNGLA